MRNDGIDQSQTPQRVIAQRDSVPKVAKAIGAVFLALHFIRREIRNRYLGSFSGGFWAIVQPLVQLAVYGFVFVYIFKAAPPPGTDVGYVPFLFIGLWPWTMLSESLSRATTVIQENAALIGKVAMPREVLVIASVASSFLVQIAGFLGICIALRAIGVDIELVYLPLTILLFAQLFLFALGLAFLFAAFQVFVRDLFAALPQLLMIWMFASPILYARQSLPAFAHRYMDLNLFTPYPEMFRSALLHASPVDAAERSISTIVALIVFGVGYFSFKRLEPHFEDFL